MSELTVLREIDPAARVARDVKIGPYCVVGPHVTIGPGTVLARRVSILGNTIIGSGNVIGEGSVLGAIPQDLKYVGGDTLLIIGHRNHFGSNVTVHLGTESGGYLTRIGDGNFFNDIAHVGHDCHIDNNVYLGINTMLAGHIRMYTGARLDDFSGLHQFVTLGKYSRIRRRTPCRRDVPPYADFGIVDQNNPLDAPAVLGLNEEGLRAAHLSPDAEKELRAAFNELFDDESALQTKIEQLVNMGVEGEAEALCEFCQRSLRGQYGRYREAFRGKEPPEAVRYLPPEVLAKIRRLIP